MCGIAGYWDKINGAESYIVAQMAKVLEHRGPDDTGIWCDEKSGLAIAHKRLSIIDLSTAGHQPMVSSCGRYVLVFNGEIYNHRALRKELIELRGSAEWQGYSDTETLFAAILFWGFEQTLPRLEGMFAIAMWDNVDQVLFLARDRMGEKPLYYGYNDRRFLFGSELKSLAAHPKWQGEVDRDALALYLRYNYVPSPWSIYKGVKKVPPAHYVVVSYGGDCVTDPKCYWVLRPNSDNNDELISCKPVELVDDLDVLMHKVVGERMEADVPLGSFLSGGYDSTAITAIMQAQSAKPIKTFSIGFHEEEFNEALHAKAVAQYLGTDHTELYVTQDEAMELIPMLPIIWDEPFADSSQIPTCLVSRMARKHVKVCLSGDGGDELFYGYKRYEDSYVVWKNLRLLPLPMRHKLGHLIGMFPLSLLSFLSKFLPKNLHNGFLNGRLSSIAEILQIPSGQLYYKRLMSHWKEPASIVLGASEPEAVLNRPNALAEFPDFREMMMYLDLLSYLPDDNLTKVDRASMAVGLEVRSPFLDRKMVDFSMKVPMSLKYRDNQSKWLLKQVVYRYVPPALMERKKMGFAIPIEFWLRGKLRDWAESLLEEKKLIEQGFFDPKPIRRMWSEHVEGQSRWHYYLWDVLMFQAWLEKVKLG